MEEIKIDIIVIGLLKSVAEELFDSLSKQTGETVVISNEIRNHLWGALGNAGLK